jgi:hypothetical protein
MSELLSIEQTASYLGVNPRIIDSAIRNGYLKAIDVDGRTPGKHTTRRDVEHWLNPANRGL